MAGARVRQRGRGCAPCHRPICCLNPLGSGRRRTCMRWPSAIAMRLCWFNFRCSMTGVWGAGDAADLRTQRWARGANSGEDVADTMRLDLADRSQLRVLRASLDSYASVRAVRMTLVHWCTGADTGMHACVRPWTPVPVPLCHGCRNGTQPPQSSTRPWMRARQRRSARATNRPPSATCKGFLTRQSKSSWTWWKSCCPSTGQAGGECGLPGGARARKRHRGDHDHDTCTALIATAMRHARSLPNRNFVSLQCIRITLVSLRTSIF